MALSGLLAQLPSAQDRLLAVVARPASRRLILAATAIGGVGVVLAALLADSLGVGGEAGFGGLQGFGLVTGVCIALSAGAIAVYLERGRRSLALVLGALTTLAGLVILGMLVFTSFFGLHDSARLRVIQFAYVEGGALVVLGSFVAWNSGGSQSALARWLLPRLALVWAGTDAGMATVGESALRRGRRWTRRAPAVSGILSFLLALPALDLALAAVLLTWVVMSAFSLEESVRAVAVPFAYVLVPFIPGYLALRVIARLRGAEIWPWTVASRFVTSWFLGALIFTALTMTFQHLGFRPGLERLDVVYFALVAGGWLAVNVPDHRESLRVDLGSTLTGLRFHWPLLLVLFFSIWPRLITGYYDPFPQIERNFSDPRITSQDTLRMIEDGYLTLTNVSHPPGVVSVTGVLAELLKIEPLSIMWVVSFGQFAVFAAGIYALAWRMTSSRQVSTLAALFGLFVFSGAVAFEGTPLRLRSNTLIYSFFPLALIAVHEVVTRVPPVRGRGIWAIGWPMVFIGVSLMAFFLTMNLQVFTPLPIEWRGMVMLGVFAVVLGSWRLWRPTRFGWQGSPMLLVLIGTWQLFHVYESPIFVASMLGFALVLSLQRDERRGWLELVVIGSVFSVFAFMALAELLPSTTASRLIFGHTYDNKTGGIGQKLSLMDRATAFVAIAFFLAGVGIAAKRRSAGLIAVLTMAALGYALYFFPDAHTIRAYKIITPFFAILAATGSIALYARLRARSGSTWLAPALGCAGVVLLAVAITRPLQNHFSDIREGQSYFSALNDAEYAALDWFNANTGYDARILSDYQTMQLFNTVGNIPSLVERKYWPAEMTDQGRAQLQDVRNKVLFASSVGAQKAHDDALALTGTEPEEEKLYLETAGKQVAQPRIFIVWSARTGEWITKDDLDPIFVPNNEMPDMGQIAPFLNAEYFTPVFNYGPWLWIFEVKRP